MCVAPQWICCSISGSAVAPACGGSLGSYGRTYIVRHSALRPEKPAENEEGLLMPAIRGWHRERTRKATRAAVVRVRQKEVVGLKLGRSTVGLISQHRQEYISSVRG
jgi:hypothetical protein